ncbi:MULTISPECIES: sigma-E factor negative regulatory protein [Paraburkholderia]|uniref:Anti-sigma factor n=1 Tax=Paraburkholderia caribensis TaxID=75105 RepID=A0A9Q6RZB1_9BURK|nr:MULTISPECIES: RseA family anti-sigma factor [Paraburkholderia]ALP63523.1 anti-sigma factor [Paraburkholderia caribensis]AUT51223.1 anti-sigma factor [Paraburkholderia caribensis]MCO4878013.1 sigma-E factor negative regulatory protein [Paraburkholderia caribensis]PTB27251.1 anti-sigma factor [Paraburkholderia caribensis]QLB61686.1 anti-sigma factor [Paraburkholderia caribensis]
MGSVSMPMQSNAQANSQGERLSAFVDGELLDGEHPNTILAALGREDRATWSCYHLIGDALRSDDLAVSPATSSAFLNGFAARFESEAHVLAPVSVPATRRLLALRRRVVPAFAVAAAAATLTWIVMPQLSGVGTGVTQVASVAPHADSVQRVAMASMPAATTAEANVSDGNIIRDASLDQYLEAHQQFGLQPVVSGSMPLLRAASLTTQGH